MYIAIKNTEHKGVYKKEHFKKEWRIQGASIRSFNSNELDAALKWAGVKALSIPSSSDPNLVNKGISKQITPTITKPENPLIKILQNFKKRGALGVCISTRNLGDLILKLNPVYFLCISTRGYYDDLNNLDNGDFIEILEYALDNYNSVSNYEYNFLEIPQISKFHEVNDSFLKLTDFWAIKSSNSITYECYDIDSLFEFECSGFCNPEELDFTDEYYLNVNDIIGIKEIGFVQSGNSYLIPDSHYNFNYITSLYKFEYSKAISLLDNYDVENVYNYTY